MRHLLKSARRCSSGSTAIEYALIAGIMAVALVAGATGVGGSLSAVFEFVADVFG